MNSKPNICIKELSNLKLNIDRLWENLMHFNRFSAGVNDGISRIALSKEDESARQWLVSQLKDAGLVARIDGALNVIGQIPSNHPNAKTIAIGSHLDSVPNGGMFDGALGVIAGLEIVRCLKASKQTLPFHIELIAFCDEEGAHMSGTVGSRAMLGKLEEEEINRSPEEGTRSFSENVRKLGYDPNNILKAVRNPNEFIAFLEIHIEQGPVLEQSGIDIGIVSAFAGIRRFEIMVQGESGHSGTCPMHHRKDALVMAAPFFNALPVWTQSISTEMVATIGKLQLSPGAVNVIPDQCRFIVEMRSQNAGDLDRLAAQIKSYVDDHDAFSILPVYHKKNCPLNADFISHICQAAKREKVSSHIMPSGAGHDAQTFASLVPTGMIFIPCRKGISHSPLEWAEKSAVEKGSRVLLRSLTQIMAKHLLN